MDVFLVSPFIGEKYKIKDYKMTKREIIAEFESFCVKRREIGLFDEKNSIPTGVIDAVDSLKSDPNYIGSQLHFLSLNCLEKCAGCSRPSDYTAPSPISARYESLKLQTVVHKDGTVGLLDKNSQLLDLSEVNRKAARCPGCSKTAMTPKDMIVHIIFTLCDSVMQAASVFEPDESDAFQLCFAFPVPTPDIEYFKEITKRFRVLLSDMYKSTKDRAHTHFTIYFVPISPFFDDRNESHLSNHFIQMYD